MKIKAFADAQGVSVDRMNRAAIWALAQTNREKPRTGGRHGGVDLTDEEQRLCLEYLAGHRKNKPREFDPIKYELDRLGWLKTWVDAYDSKVDVKTKGDRLAMIGGIVCAKSRRWLFEPCLDARNGDLLVELAYRSAVDRKDGVWNGFTSYLLQNGFESPGWGTF